MTASTPEKSEGCWSRYRVTIEPVMAVAFFVLTLAGSPLTDLVVMQACQRLNMDVDTCQNDESVDDEVHRTTSTFTLWRIIIETLPGCIMSLFTSPWSEMNGRKPVLIVSLIGVTLSQACLAYMSSIEKINPYWYLVTAIPTSLSGGFILIIVSSYCYTIDITKPEDRVLRLAIVNEVTTLFTITASLITPILDNIGYIAVFGTNAILLCTILVYVYFFLPESIQVEPENKKTLFTTDHLIDSFRTFFKKRPAHVRSAIFALTACGVVSLLVVAGEIDCKYLAVMKRFHWKIEDYSVYTAVCQVVSAIGTVSGVYLLMKLFGFGYIPSTIIIQISLLTGTFLTAISNTPVMFYIASQFRIFYGCLSPVIKGFISTLVPPHDVAKVVAFGSSLEAFMPQVGAMLYANVYNVTVGTYPFAIFGLSFVLQFVVLIWTAIALAMLHYGGKNTQGKSDEESGEINDNTTNDVEVTKQ